LDRVSALTDAVQASGSRVLVGFQYRYHPGLRTLKELLDSGEMGNPLSVTSHWGEYLPDWHPWEDYRKGYSAQRDLGGGVVLTLSHPFDYLRWLIGEVVLVSGKTKRSGHLDIDVEDQADINLEFRNGVHGAIHLDYLERPASHWLEIGCSKGTLHWNSLDGLLRVKFSNGRDKEFPVPEGFERNDLFLAQTRHFIDVITGKANPICTLEDGIKALQIALAVHSSSRQGKSIYL
jgi:predicted dehydrogenase